MGDSPVGVHGKRRFSARLAWASGRGGRARYFTAAVAVAVAGTGVAVGVTVTGTNALANTVGSVPVPHATPAKSWVVSPHTATPIKHLVVLFDENVSFDHYFGTYPFATNTDGTTFHAKPFSSRVNGLYSTITSSGPTGPLLTANPNEFNPQRLTHSQALTCDQNHAYTAEQLAADGGKMDKFVQNTDTDTCTGQPILYGAPGLGMDYYDGNTVTAMWNYAQHYAMSDNNYDTTWGPSTPGALNLISGQTGGAYAVSPTTGVKVPAPTSVSALNSSGQGSIFGDLDPAFDDCSDGSHASTNPVGVETGKNIGDLLNAQGVTWGWFQGGFAPTGTNAAGFAVCGASHNNIGGNPSADYSPHHNPFEYYQSTANPKHLPPSSEAAIGQTDQANHQYDLSLFADTLKDGNLPSVSFLKAAEYQDAHPGYSDPLDEQNFLVNTINEIEQSKYWASTAIVITYDDSDGWYDHVAPPIVNGSNAPQDAAICSSAPTTLDTFIDRCGFGIRLPLVVISPWTRSNYVSHNQTNTASIPRFIEDNWLGGTRIAGSYDAISGSLDAPRGVLDFFASPQKPLILDPTTGAVVSQGWGD
jgi:phospholipase C